MSGNSACSRRQTAPIVSSRVRSCRSACAVLTLLLQVRQLVLADLELVAVLEPRRRLDALPVQERAVEAPEILDVVAVVLLQQHGVLARDGDVVEEDVVLGRAADGRAVALRHEVLARAAAPGTDHERRPLGAEILERHRALPRLPCFVRRVAHRRFGARLVLDEQRAAAGAVVGGLRVLEPTLGTVDMAHYPSAGGAALPARIAASRSTSTCSSTLLPPVSRSRAWSSARSRSIFPCRMRLRYETSCSSLVSSSMSRLRSSSESEARSGKASTEVLSSEERAFLVYAAAC